MRAGGSVVCLSSTSTDDWPVERAADALLNKLEEWKAENPGERVALIADGELSSPVTGKGVGGRNSAFVLSCVEKIAGRKITVLSAGTDGVDGNSPGAGAVAGRSTYYASPSYISGRGAVQLLARFTYFDLASGNPVVSPSS